MASVIVVTGSREATAAQHQARIRNRIDVVAEYLWSIDADPVLYHGGCRGVDLIAAESWRELHGDPVAFPADWEPAEGYDRAAGHKRNQRMLEAAIKAVGQDNVVVLGFPVRGAANRGTKDCLDRAFRLGLDYRVCWLKEAPNA